MMELETDIQREGEIAFEKYRIKTRNCLSFERIRELVLTSDLDGQTTGEELKHIKSCLTCSKRWNCFSQQASQNHGVQKKGDKQIFSLKKIF